MPSAARAAREAPLAITPYRSWPFTPSLPVRRMSRTDIAEIRRIANEDAEAWEVRAIRSLAIDAKLYRGK